MRQYADNELGNDGYPHEWHATIKHAVRELAGHRCERCGHPYRNGEHGTGEWTPCDERCAHQDDGPLRVVDPEGKLLAEYRAYNGGLDIAFAGWMADDAPDAVIEAHWRILTVHHLDGDKANCRWWNLAALCQRCHLTIQGRVRMAQVFPFEHSEWFKPHAAGFYAWTYVGEDLSREETITRLDELLALELMPALGESR